MNDTSNPAKSKKKEVKHDLMMIALDCGSNMQQKESEAASSFDLAKEIADWIVSRKLFTKSKDKLNITLYGVESAISSSHSNVATYDEVFSTVGVDHLKFITHEASQTNISSSVVNALLVSLNNIVAQLNGDSSVDGKSLLLITNGLSDLSDDDQEQLKDIAKTINSLGISVVLIGGSEEDSTPGMQSLLQFIEQVEGTHYSFENAGEALGKFSFPKSAPRALKKNWEIAPGVRLPLNMYINTAPTKNPLQMISLDEKGDEVKRQTTYYVNQQGGSIPPSQNMEAPSSSSNKMDTTIVDPSVTESVVVDKKNAVFGYSFGTSKIVVNADDEASYNNHNYNEKEERGCLKLIQFTPKSNILPSYLLGNNSYIAVPAWDPKSAVRDHHLMKTTFAMIEGMLEEDVVAICRYAHDSSKHVHLMALVPKRNEENNLSLIGVRIPFFDDWKSYSLPKTSENPEDVPNNAQFDLVDELITEMDLRKTGFDNKKIPDPFFQTQCTAMKMKALSHSSKNVDQLATDAPMGNILKRYLEVDPKLKDQAKNVFEAFIDPENRSGFNLQEVHKNKAARKVIIPDSKSHLKGPDVKPEHLESTVASPETQTMTQTLGQSKIFKLLQKALDVGGHVLEQFFTGLAMQMQLFDGSSLSSVEMFKFARQRFIDCDRASAFNSWLMSIQGDSDFYDFNSFMDQTEAMSLITCNESSSSNYTDTDGQMYWSGLAENKEDKKFIPEI